MNVLEKYAENKDVCAYLYVLRCTCASLSQPVHECGCIYVCTEVNTNSSAHRSFTLESQLSTLAVSVPA